MSVLRRMMLRSVAWKISTRSRPRSFAALQAISAFARGAVRPEPLIDRVVRLDDLAAVLGGGGPATSGAPKVQVVP